MCVCVCNRCVCNLCVGNLCVYGRISTKDVDRYEKIPKRAPHMGVGRIFSRGVYSGFFQMVTKIFFQGWPTVMKFHFTNSKLREKLLSTKTLKGKYQISISREDWPPCHPLPTPVAPTSVSVIELLSHQWTFFCIPQRVRREGITNTWGPDSAARTAKVETYSPISYQFCIPRVIAMHGWSAQSAIERDCLIHSWSPVWRHHSEPDWTLE